MSARRRGRSRFARAVSKVHRGSLDACVTVGGETAFEPPQAVAASARLARIRHQQTLNIGVEFHDEDAIDFAVPKEAVVVRPPRCDRRLACALIPQVLVSWRLIPLHRTLADMADRGVDPDVVGPCMGLDEALPPARVAQRLAELAFGLGVGGRRGPLLPSSSPIITAPTPATMRDTDARDALPPSET
jgi:hypothetical protein